MTARRSHLSVSGRAFPNIDFLISLRPTNFKLGLENITSLLGKLGNPQHRVPTVLVGGTNGKGSVTTLISTILQAYGLKVGTFYSPHLFRINERIRVDGVEIPSPELDDILGELREFYPEAPFTFFEGLTAAAILYFVREGADITVFEVGLGGRLDATRLVNAMVTVITGISRDHREHLGKTTLKILGEKLGIVRCGVPLIANLNSTSLRKRSQKYCLREGAPFFSVSDEVSATLKVLEPDRMVVDLRTPRRRYGDLVTRLIGTAQVRNIATAVRAVEILLEAWRMKAPDGRHRCGGYRHSGTGKSLRSSFRARFVPLQAVREGIGNAFLAGRFQVLPGNPRIILDVSHNEEALLASLDTLLSFSRPERNVLIFGVQAHKELGVFPKKAVRSAREIILTSLRDRRSARGATLHDIFREAGSSAASVTASLTVARGMKHALRIARTTIRPQDVMLILGSHLTVEEAAAYI